MDECWTIPCRAVLGRSSSDFSVGGRLVCIHHREAARYPNDVGCSFWPS